MLSLKRVDADPLPRGPASNMTARRMTALPRTRHYRVFVDVSSAADGVPAPWLSE